MSRDPACPPHERPLTDAEAALTHAMFGDAIATGDVRIRRRAWWPLQPRNVVMAPRGHIHFHARSQLYRPCFGDAPPEAQALFLHEMTHVWQHQSGISLILRRHPWCRYDYAFVPGKRFTRYGIEQQAEIVADVFLLRQGRSLPGRAPLDALEAILPFGAGA